MANWQPPRAEDDDGGLANDNTKPSNNGASSANNQRDKHSPTAQPEQAAAPPAPAAAGTLEIKFEDQHGNSTAFKLKPTTPLKKAMDVYCARHDAERRTLRFLFEGNRVQEGDTPASVSVPGRSTFYFWSDC